MKTSYYAISGRKRHAVSIAAKAPVWFKGQQYKKLAPRYWFFKRYKDDGDEDYYTKQYYKEVLDKLDPQEVYDELGKDAVLLCYEKPNKFCHRHLVSAWLNKKLGLNITEL